MKQKLTAKQMKKHVKLMAIQSYIDKFGLLDAGDSAESNQATMALFSSMSTKQLSNIAWLASRAFSGGYKTSLEDHAVLTKIKRGAK